jgi:hypothetical protein
MTPKEKAVQMVNKYINDYGEKMPDGSFMLCIVSYGRAKQCALIAWEEVFEFMKPDDEKHDCCHWANSPESVFWSNVKKEIENLK